MRTPLKLPLKKEDYPLKLSRTSLNTFRMDSPCGTFYAKCDCQDQSCKNKAKKRRCPPHFSDIPKIEKDYEIYDVARDGNCFIYAYMVVLIHFLTDATIVKSSNSIQKKIEILQNMAERNYKQLFEAKSDSFFGALREKEKIFRFIEAHERFLKCVPKMLDLLDRLKNIEKFKDRIDFLNKVPRIIFQDFIRAGFVVYSFGMGGLELFFGDFLIRKKTICTTHILDCSFWLSSGVLRRLLEFLEIDFLEYSTDIIDSRTFKWVLGCTEIQKVIVIFNDLNDFQVALDPSVMKKE